jgi:hypothetical protein
MVIKQRAHGPGKAMRETTIIECDGIHKGNINKVCENGVQMSLLKFLEGLWRGQLKMTLKQNFKE